MSEKKTRHPVLPVIAVRDMMLFPHMTMNLDVGRPKSLAALEYAMEHESNVLIVAQSNEDIDDPSGKDLYTVGTIATINQVMNLPGDVSRILVEGVRRGIAQSYHVSKGMLTATVTPYETNEENTPELEAGIRAVQDAMNALNNVSQRLASDALQNIYALSSPDEFTDILAANLLPRLTDRQKILETLNIHERLEVLCAMIERETEIAGIERRIQAKVHASMEKNQRDFYLREQLRAVQSELGQIDGSEEEELRKRMESTPLSDEAREKCLKEIERLSHMGPGTPEISTTTTYIEWILDLPWGKTTEDNLDLARAREVLNKNHYGLDKVKERIIEYLAVLQVKKDMKGPILCFVGPPGVGKTSIVRAIAEAIGRKFIQMSLGGVRDEAEIRGHRRTYLGAIPGRIINGLKQAGTMNPVFLFDEIDKMSSDIRGDPASAMLEVLDAEQNMAFRDHYMELAFDLSKVMFITTANSVDSIPAPLFDRMEIIEVPSYTEEEKLHIASLHLLPKQTEAHGLQPGAVTMNEDILRRIIEGYTREAGVRTLERTIAKVVRKSVVAMLDSGTMHRDIDLEQMHEYLGAERYTREMPEQEPRVGIVNGLAYTQVGGETLEVECSTMPGKGVLHLTGKLGDVMKESAEAALTWVRSHSSQLGLPEDFHDHLDLHVHVPEGAVPKDGPSAGVTIITALTSALTGIPVRHDVAMTGELTLRGRVLPIGGLKEKTLAAYRAGIRVLIIPKENVKDLEEIPAYVLSQFRIVAADQIEDVLKEALVRLPEGLQASLSAD